MNAMAEKLKAKTIINGIPKLIKERCEITRARGGTGSVGIIVVDFEDKVMHDYLQSHINDTSKLKGAAKIVYDYCQNKGLNPTIGQWYEQGTIRYPDDSCGYGFTIHITVKL